MPFEPQDYVFTFFIVVFLIWLSIMSAKVYSGFQGTLRSVPQAINLGPSHMSRPSDRGYDFSRNDMSFLGGPMGGESPVFYDIGDISASRDAVVASGVYERDQDNNLPSTASGFASRKKNGFADLDELLVRSSR